MPTDKLVCEILTILDEIQDDLRWVLNKAIYYCDEDYAEDREELIKLRKKYFGD